MISEQFIMYCVAIFAVSIIPGPSMALAFSEGAKCGIKGTIPAALGNVVASLGQGVVAFFAFQSVVSLEPRVLLYIHLIGAAYIAYVGIVFIRKRQSFILDTAEIKTSATKIIAQFRTGFLVAFFNPKAILFFVALFPQFIAVNTISSLGAINTVFLPIALIALICFLVYGCLGQVSLRILDGTRVFQLIISGLGGCLVLTSIVGFVDVVSKFL